MDSTDFYRQRHWAYKQETDKVLHWLKRQTSTEYASINYYIRLARQIKGPVPQDILESLQKAIYGRLKIAEDHVVKGNADPKHDHFIYVLDEISRIFDDKSRSPSPSTSTTSTSSFESDTDSDSISISSQSSFKGLGVAATSAPTFDKWRSSFAKPTAPQPSLISYVLSQEFPPYTHEAAWDPAWNCTVPTVFPSQI